MNAINEGNLASSTLWSDVIPKHDLEIYEAAGYGASHAIGSSTAVLVVDCNYRFFGRTPLPIDEAVRDMRTSCGVYAWQTIPSIKQLLRLARSKGAPVIYSTSPAEMAGDETYAWRFKNQRVTDDAEMSARESDIVSDIAPTGDDRVIEKVRPSVFFGTELKEELDKAGIDSVICVGGVTSGCVRSTVVDAFSHGFQVTVLADATFDRSDFMHRVSLFDMQAKYANVMDFRTLESEWS